MNCESCEEPKNSFSAATTGRMLMIVCGVIVSTSSVVIRSRTPRSTGKRPRRRAALAREVLRVLGHAELHGKIDEPSHERQDVLGRQDASVLWHLHAEALVQFVATDLREVIALGIEEQ